MKHRVHVRIIPRDGLLDPQGQAITHALAALGFGGVSDVRVGKAIEVDVDSASSDEAATMVRSMCERLLANPVTEDFHISAGPA